MIPLSSSLKVMWTAETVCRRCMPCACLDWTSIASLYEQVASSILNVMATGLSFCRKSIGTAIAWEEARRRGNFLRTALYFLPVHEVAS